MPVHYPLHDSPPSQSPFNVSANLIDFPQRDAVRVRLSQTITVSPLSGRIVSMTHTPSIPARSLPTIVPGFYDLHLHAPQHPQLATRTDLPLLRWLEEYTFPLEARYADAAFARRQYGQLVRRLLREGTTSAAVYATGHVEATKELADACARYGLRAWAGLVAADLGPSAKSTQANVSDTREFVQWVRGRWGAGPDAQVVAAVTPRFLPSCSRALMLGLRGVLDEERAAGAEVWWQTHAVESVDEVLMVKQQWGGARDVQLLFEELGYPAEKSVLAHCVHLSEDEMALLGQATVACCPVSNVLFARGVLPVKRLMERGVRLGLGTDIAGGHSASVLQNVRVLGLTSRVAGFAPRGSAGEVEDDESEEVRRRDVVDWREGMWLATRGGALAMDVHDGGVFEEGCLWDALEVELGIEGEEDEDEDEDEDLEIKLERWVVGHGGEHSIRRVWGRGREVFYRD